MTTTPLRSLATATAAGLVLSAGALGLGATSAGAAVRGPAVTASKAACHRAIDQRLFVLAISEQRIGQVRRLTDAQRATQISGIDAVEANLTTVNRPALNAAVGRAQIRAACRAIYDDNRVYAVVVPQLFASVRIDELGNAVERFGPKISAALAADRDTSAVEALVGEASAHLDTASAIVSAITPDSFNADPDGTRAQFSSATDELNAAFGALLRAVVAYRDMMA